MINTERLTIVPLTYEQLIKYIKNDNSLEHELNLNESDRKISDDLKDALVNTIIPNVAKKNENYLYSTLWTAILKSENCMIGELCMMGEPSAKGEVEIGYGIYRKFRNNGFMTEFVEGIIEWLKTQPKVKCVKASTQKENISSCRVLEKSMFSQVSEDEGLVSWKLTIRDNE